MPIDASIRIDVVIMSKARQWDEPFTPTITYNNDFHWTSTLDTYEELLPEVELTILSHIADEIDKGAETTTHVNLWIDNVTHATLAHGVVKLPKTSHDFTWSQLDIEKEGADISDALASALSHLRNLAKY